jgi:hypothetical protein
MPQRNGRERRNNGTNPGSIQTIVSCEFRQQFWRLDDGDWIGAIKVLHSLSHLVTSDRSFFLRKMPYYKNPAQHSGSDLGKEAFAEAFLLPSWRC